MRRSHREEPLPPCMLRVAVLGVDIDAAKDLARWLVARAEDGTARNLCHAEEAASQRAPLEMHVTLQASIKERDLVESCAVAAEMILIQAPCAACAHIAQAGHSALLHADLVVDVRGGSADDIAARREDLSQDMLFLCPGTPLVVHVPGTSLAEELSAVL